MRKTILYHVILLIFASQLLQGQPDFPKNGEVFVDTVVPRVDIFLDPDTLQWIYQNVESYQEFHATFVFNNGNILDTIENVGFRLRGNTSRYSAKKSFKVSFNTFDPGRKWYGLEKLNLNGEHNDPSVIRAKLCWDLLGEFGVPTARANHVELYINNNYHGLYINIEHIDEEFVLSRFGNNDGNLFKCLWPADLHYLGSNPDNYKLTAGERRVYDLKTNKIADDYTDIAHFIDVLNNTPDEDFICELEKIFNLQTYLKIIAFDVITANWDGYIFNKNNFYLYHNTETGKFEYINYDVDNTFGIDWFGVDWGSQSIYSWTDDYRPLYTRAMEIPELRDQYSYYFQKFIETLVGSTSYEATVNEIKTRNSPFIEDDPFYPLDYGFTHQDYLDSYYQGLGMHIDYGIFPYINNRIIYGMSELEEYAQLPVINFIRNNYPEPYGSLKIKAFVDGFFVQPTVTLLYSENNGPIQEIQMYDDGEHSDRDANDQVYGVVFPSIGINTSISYQVKAVNQNGETILPCEPKTYEIIESENPSLYINEFMASNATTIADEFGEYDDWIEIFNGDEEAVWLGDKYLTDNLNNPDKWQMPDFTLEPGDFILIWADNDPEQGDNHTNFKLDAPGEEIGLFDSETTGFVPIDTLSYGPQTTDVSKGRKPDGADLWIFFNSTTPGFSNSLGNVSETLWEKGFNVYPNPVSGSRIYFDRILDVTLYSGSAITLIRKTNVNQLDISSLKAGLYFIRTDVGQTAKLVIP